MWQGNYIPKEAKHPDHYYFIRIKTRFYLKEGKLPFIQLKNSYMYVGTESLTTSDLYDREKDCYYSEWVDSDGNIRDTAVDLTLTMTDYELIKEHYTLVNPEIIGGCWFYAQVGIFDEYIEKYKKIKLVSKGAQRELAKLFLNNLYGKMASSTNSSFKVAVSKDGNNIGFLPVHEEGKKPGYIPVGSAITSYARNFTIRAAQKNYHGPDKPGFIYADTDSIHCDLSPDQIVGIKADDVAFCCWKLESCWDEAIFTRQKTYIEHIVKENLQDVEEPYYNIKCAGMPDKCKKLFEISITGGDLPEQMTEEEKEFLLKDGERIVRTLKDFKVGLKVPGKLIPKRIPGGVLLKETTYEMR